MSLWVKRQNEDRLTSVDDVYSVENGVFGDKGVVERILLGDYDNPTVAKAILVAIREHIEAMGRDIPTIDESGSYTTKPSPTVYVMPKR